MKSNAPHSPGATEKKVLRETGSENMKGAWKGESSPGVPAKAGGHPGKPFPSSPGMGQDRGGQRTRHLVCMQPWFPAVPGSLLLSRFPSLLTSLKPPSRAESSRHNRYRCLREMNLAKRAQCRVPGVGKIIGHSNDSPYACACHLSLNN